MCRKDCTTTPGPECSQKLLMCDMVCDMVPLCSSSKQSSWSSPTSAGVKGTCPLLFQLEMLSRAHGRTTLNAPGLVSSQKLSRGGPGWRSDGRSVQHCLLFCLVRKSVSVPPARSPPPRLSPLPPPSQEHYWQKLLIFFLFRVNQDPERSLSQASLGGLGRIMPLLFPPSLSPGHQ